jgi:non-canonical (house-cleaning) NTP pyrophosphatase
MFVSGWVAAVDGEGREGIGSGGRALLPDSVAEEIRKGKELGPVMDTLLGDRNTKQKLGAVGSLTRGLVPRVEAFERTVIYALTKFIRPELYPSDDSRQ